MSRSAEPTRGCKGCGDEFRLSEERIARAVAALETEPERCVPDDVYRTRLAACAECEKLQGGVTCQVCGCIVRVAAKLRERRCPLPGDDRWSGR